MTLYNLINKDNLSVDDIKNYIDEGNTAKESNIWQYINWYRSDGKELFIEYEAEFALILDRENGDGEFTKKYGNKIFYNLTIDEQKEVVEYIYNQRIS